MVPERQTLVILACKIFALRAGHLAQVLDVLGITMEGQATQRAQLNGRDGRASPVRAQAFRANS